MSNYLFDLIAKSFNLIDTVQPLVLSVFEPLPEAHLDWEQLITTESTELETSETDRFSNPEILESLEWRCLRQASLTPTTNLQISEEIINPFLTNLSSTPIQSSQHILKSISNLVRKPDLELSSNRSFSESVLTQISTENQQLTSNTEQKPSTTLPTFAPVLSDKQPTKINPVVSFVQSANIDNRQLASNTEQKASTTLPTFTPVLSDKQLTKINPIVSFVQSINIDNQQLASNTEQKITTTPLTFTPVLSEKQPTKINPVVSFVQSANIDNQQLASNTEQKPSTTLSTFAPVLSEKQPTKINPAVSFVQSANIDNQQLASNTEQKTTTTPLIFVPVLSEKQPNPINLEPFYTQPFLESKIFSTNLNQILPHPNTQILKSVFVPQTKTFLSNRLISVQNTESNTSLSNPISKQRQLTPKFLLQQPIEINHLDLSLQIPFNENSTKPVIFPFAPQEKTFSQQNLNTTIFRTAIANENNAPVSNLVAEKSGELTTQLLNNQSLEISRAVSLHHLPKVLNFKETSTILSIPSVIQQGKSTTENLHKQPRDINPVFTHSQLPLVESSKAFSSQLQSELTAIPLVNFANAPTITQLSPLTPALAVETSTPTFSAFQPQEQLITESSQKRLLQTGNILNSEILSSQIVEQPTAILPVKSANTSTITQESPSTPGLVVETITPISTAIQPQQQLTNELPQKQTLQTPNISSSEMLSSQIIEQPTAILPVISANTSAITQESPLTPALAVETITPISTTIQPQKLTDEFLQKQTLQTRNISSIQVQQLMGSQLSIPEKSADNTPVANKILPTNQKTLSLGLTVETSTPVLNSVIFHQEQPASELTKQQSRQIIGNVLSSQVQKLISSQLHSSEILEEPVAIPTLREPIKRTISSANAYILDRTLSNSHKQSLIPKIITETNATLLHSTVEPQEKLTPDLPKIQQRFVHKNVASIQPLLTDASAKISSFHTNISTLPFVDNLPSSAINSDIVPNTILDSSNVGTDIQSRVNFSDSHLSDFRREKASAQEIGSQNHNQNYRKHIPIEKFGVAQRWGELGKGEGEMNVSYAHHPGNMQLHNINSNEAMLTNPVENLILPQNAPPNFSMSADRGKDGVKSSDFRQLEESDLISSSDSHFLLKFLPVSPNDKSSSEHDIRPLSEPINDLAVKNLSVIARSSEKLQKRWRSRSVSKRSPLQTSPLVDAPPAIQVTIGRLEVRSAAPAPPPPRPKPRPAPSVMSLNEYLQRRARRG
nr:hypothetical protein [Nostoc sp. DedSLP05]